LELPPLLIGDYLIAVHYQPIEVDLLGPLMVVILHAMEVKEFASGSQYPFRKREKLCLFINGIFFRGYGCIVYRGTVEENSDIVHLLQHEISHAETVPEGLRIVTAGDQGDIHGFSF
jgi:hypothetical protein